VPVLTDWITLDTFEVSCIVGVLDAEQRTPQPLVLGLRLGLDLTAAGDEDALDRSVDYATVTDLVTFLVVEGRFRLLESMGLAIARLLLAPPAAGEGRAAIDRVELTLRKPTILGGRAVPGVAMARDRESLAIPRVRWADGVDADVLIVTPRTRAYRVRVPAGAAFPAGFTRRPIAAGCELAVAQP
jgi:dihydroneopterin aldolase